MKDQGIPLSSHPGHQLYVRSSTPNSNGEVPEIAILKREREGLRGEKRQNNYPKVLFPKISK